MRPGFLAFAFAAIFSAAVTVHADPVPHWRVDAARSQLAFTYEQEGQAKQGHFGQFEADIALDPAVPETASVTVHIGLASVSAGSKDADGSLKSADFFAVAKFPEALFKSTRVTRDGTGYRMDGTLTIRDKTVPVSLPFTLTVTGDEAHAVGTLTLDRLAFGLGTGLWANPKFIGHQVTVRIDLMAHKSS